MPTSSERSLKIYLGSDVNASPERLLRIQIKLQSFIPDVATWRTSNGGYHAIRRSIGIINPGRGTAAPSGIRQRGTNANAHLAGGNIFVSSAKGRPHCLRAGESCRHHAGKDESTGCRFERDQ